MALLLQSYGLLMRFGNLEPYEASGQFHAAKKSERKHAPLSTRPPLLQLFNVFDCFRIDLAYIDAGMTWYKELLSARWIDM